jgi:hypothetical protein
MIKIIIAAFSIVLLAGSSGALSPSEDLVGYSPKSSIQTGSGVLADGTASRWVTLSAEQANVSLQNKLMISQGEYTELSWDVFDADLLASISQFKRGNMNPLGVKSP